VLAVQPGRGHGAEEELRAVGKGVLAAKSTVHGLRSRHDRRGIWLKLRRPVKSWACTGQRP
jgi:hypothetical protein